MGSNHASGGETEDEVKPKLVLIALGVLALTSGAIYLLKTNPVAGRWAQAYDPTGVWWLSLTGAF